MADLILGPLLRRAVSAPSGGNAVIWVQTDAPATVTVIAGEATVSKPTFEVRGVHLALPILTGLPEGSTEYRVLLDGNQVWPPPGQPPSVITIGGPQTITFGSCRDARERRDPDALRAYAQRMKRGGELPGLLAMIGDQIYADDTWEFGEYVELYRKAWSDPDVRWLLSTVPTVMIFDDHEIHDDWNSSAAWVAEMSARPHWQEHIRAGLLSYWLFQHLGNLTPDEIEAADPHTPPEDWSFTLDLGRVRIVMLDCRGSRVLEGPRRRMFPQAQWDRLRQAAHADCDHLVIAASLPWLLAPAIHHAEAAMEVLSRRSRTMERLRREYDLEHWAAVGDSFAELTAIIKAATGPATVLVLGGDVHHSYLAEAAIPGRPRTYQIVCSPFSNSLGRSRRLLLEIGWNRVLSVPSALVARLAGVPRPALSWRRVGKAYYGNAIATVTFEGRDARVYIADSSGEVVSAARI